MDPRGLRRRRPPPLGDRLRSPSSIGSKNEQPLNHSIHAQAPGSVDLTGQTTLADAVALIRRAALVVTNDSGLMHVAAALGKPAVSIFGPTNPVQVGPYGQPASVVRLDPPLFPLQFPPAQPMPQRSCLHAGPFCGYGHGSRPGSPDSGAPSVTLLAMSTDSKPAPPPHRKLPIFAAFAQGFFCTVLGLWPVAALPAFQSVTGMRPDHWLITLAGLLLAGIGISMIISAIRRDIAFEVFTIGIVTALSLAATDVIFVIERSIPLLYLLDAVAESLFVTLWVFAIRDLRRSRHLLIDPAIPANIEEEPTIPAVPPTVGTTTVPGGPDATG